MNEEMMINWPNSTSFPTYGDWNYYCYHYYYNTRNGSDVSGEKQQDLYVVEKDLYGGDQGYYEDQLHKPTLLTTTNAVIFSPRKTKRKGEKYEFYVEEEKENEKDWAYDPKEQPPKIRTQRVVVDEDLYKIPSNKSYIKVKVLSFISSCFRPTCVL